MCSLVQVGIPEKRKDFFNLMWQHEKVLPDIKIRKFVAQNNFDVCQNYFFFCL